MQAENAVDANGLEKQKQNIIDVESDDEGGVDTVEQVSLEFSMETHDESIAVEVNGRCYDGGHRGGASEATDEEAASFDDDGGGKQPLEVRQFRFVLHRVDQNGGTAPKQKDAPNAQQG